MAVEDLDIDERDALDCLDEYFSATEKEPDEFDCYDIADRYGWPPKSAFSKMIELERKKLFTSRLVRLPEWQRSRRVWKKVQ